MSDANRIEQLEHEVSDINCIWSIDDFKEYMDNNGYAYIIEANEREEYILGCVDINCKILHIPDGIVEIRQLFTGETKP